MTNFRGELCWTAIGLSLSRFVAERCGRQEGRIPTLCRERASTFWLIHNGDGLSLESPSQSMNAVCSDTFEELHDVKGPTRYG
jgi:hypothetical protein